jgi:glycosyltransferase involved in cell wall biosynthesis
MLRALKVLDDAAARHGWELRFVLAEPDPLVVASGLAADRVRYLRALRRWRRWTARVALPVTVLRLASLARGADLFYACTLSSFPYCLLAGRLLRIPHVAHVYSSYGDGAAYRKHLLGRVHHVVAPSADSLRLAEEALGGFPPGTQAHVAYNGMDVARIVREAEEPGPALALPAGVPRIGMVGNLDQRKNPALLVEAAALMRESTPDFHVLLVGAFRDPRYEAAVRSRIAALGLERQVTVTGFLANPFPVVRTLDILAHPARRDPFPLALLEGMALARPIVASAVGGIPEMLVDGESGLLVPSDDAAALARTLVSLLRDPAARARLGAAAHERLVTRFSLAGFAARMFGIFDQAVAAGAA